MRILLLIGVGVLAALGGLGSVVLSCALGVLAARKDWRWSALWAALVVLTSPVAVLDYAQRVDALTAKRATTGLDTRDRAAVWWLNLTMAGVGAAVGFPEAAVETALLAVPGPAERSFHSPFPMRDAGVRQAVERMARSGPGTLPHHRVTWTYGERGRSDRVALACNALDLSGVAVPDGDGLRLDLEGRVDIRYPQRARLHLFTLAGRRVGIDEGLFADLQDAGWLFPYTAVWRWSVRVEDGQVVAMGDRPGW
ncbi:MAG: hypothetical protein ACI8PZ_006061 [Myxococcota bacterium]|jgi:hypothetical protein